MNGTELRLGHGIMQTYTQLNNGQPLHSVIERAASILRKGQSTSVRELADLDALLRAMQGRHFSNPMDRVFAIAFPFTRHESYHAIDGDTGPPSMTLPIYDPKTPIPVAWELLISSIASTGMEGSDIPDLPEDKFDNVIQVSQTPTIQLLRFFPHPSRDHWFPSWAQIQKYPDVSVKDHAPARAPARAPKGTDYSLQIKSGRVYRDCTIQLLQSSTPTTKAIYLSTIGGKDAQLVATVPGIELQIDPGSRYVLVDISPDRSSWPTSSRQSCNKTKEGHKHLPIWKKSVILVCEEVDTLERLLAKRATRSASAIMKYRLRRVTTLEWGCRPTAQPGPGRWLPFKPSLVHLGSVLCSAMGGVEGMHYEGTLQDELEGGGGYGAGYADLAQIPKNGLFCFPEEIAGLFKLASPRKKWPLYGVYLV